MYRAHVLSCWPSPVLWSKAEFLGKKVEKRLHDIGSRLTTQIVLVVKNIWHFILERNHSILMAYPWSMRCGYRLVDLYIVVSRLPLFCMKMLRWESQQEDVMYIWSTRMVFRPNVHLTVSSSTSYLNLVYGGIEFVFLQFSTQFIPLFSSCHPTCSTYYFKLQLFYNSHFYLYGPVIFYLSIQPIYNLIHRILQEIFN